jgi:hypothetical protein
MSDKKIEVSRIIEQLVEHSGDLNAAFPDPFRFAKSRRGQRQVFYDWELAHLLTERDPEKPWGWDAKGAYFVIPNQKRIEDYVEGRLKITTRRSATGHCLPPEYLEPTSSENV